MPEKVRSITRRMRILAFFFLGRVDGSQVKKDFLAFVLYTCHEEAYLLFFFFSTRKCETGLEKRKQTRLNPARNPALPDDRLPSRCLMGPRLVRLGSQPWRC